MLRLAYALPALPVTPALTAAVLGVWTLCAIGFALGWHVRAAAVGLVGVITFVLLLDEQTYSNHLYLAVLMVALVAWADARRADDPPVPMFLLRAQVSIVYGWTAIAKMNASFLTGLVIYVGLPPSARAVLDAHDVARPVAMALAAAAVVIELWLAVSLRRPRVRRQACIIGVLLHVGMVAGLSVGGRLALAGFALLMFAGYAVFLEAGPAWLATLPWVRGSGRAATLTPDVGQL